MKIHLAGLLVVEHRHATPGEVLARDVVLRAAAEFFRANIIA